MQLSAFILNNHFRITRSVFEVSWILVHRKVDTALGIAFQALRHFGDSTLEILARRQGQAITIWRNTPACCEVAETYIFPLDFLASDGPLKFSLLICVVQLAILHLPGG